MTSLLKKYGKSRIVIGLFALVALAVGGVFYSKENTLYMLSQHMSGGGHMHGADGTGHDEINMPGLRGKNATPQESAELAVMFRNFGTITREVTNLPNGIRTVTRSSDEEVMNQLVSHVFGMIQRVEDKDDPKIIIQSRTLDIFFQRGDKIESEIELTDEGIVVTQTSQDTELVTALQEHAAEVTDMADRGMEAVHEKMMQ
ncbi:MAG: hypothetical protein ABJO67_05375 [Pseudoruegeria sp.]